MPAEIAPRHVTVSHGIKFRRRSRTIVDVVQEHYLRDDIPCGSAVCDICHQTPVLSGTATHYLLPDVDFILDFLELLEHPQIANVIYLSSIAKQVLESSNQRKYTRLRALYRDRRRRSILFDDEHSIPVFVRRKDILKQQNGGNLRSAGLRVGVTKVVDSERLCTGAGIENTFEADDDDDVKWKKLLRGHRSKSASFAGIQAAAEWYSEHLEARIPIVVVSDVLSTDGCGIATPLNFCSPAETNEGSLTTIQILSSAEYIQRWWAGDASVAELYDSLVLAQAEAESAAEAGMDARGKGNAFREHLSVRLVDEGIGEGVIRLGLFHVSKQAPDEGYVRPSNRDEVSRNEIFVPGRALQNRAIHGDMVAVRFLPTAQWRTPRRPLPGSSLSRTVEEDEDGGINVEEMADEDVERLADNTQEEEGIGREPGRQSKWDETGQAETEVPKDSKSQNVVPTGEVVAILQRAQQDYVACLDQADEDALAMHSTGRQESLLCVPMDRRIPKIRLRTRQVSQLAKRRFIVRIDGWDKNSTVPHGHLVRVLGQIGDVSTEMAAILVENGIDDIPFSSGALQELPADNEECPWKIPVAECMTRRDLRTEHRPFSVDPPGSKDVDDALSVRTLQNGHYEVGVHIADVSYFVHHDSLLDLEARARGTTVYLIGRRLDMLPATLSENLCSLVEGADRLAVSVIWEIDMEDDISVVDVWIGRTIIRSSHQMTYAQAQAILDGKELLPDQQLQGGKEEVARVRQDLLILSAVGERFKCRREAEGALELSSAELRFELDDNNTPVRVFTKQELHMNWIVAEMMISANSCVAEKIYRTFPSCALLRRHAPPSSDAFSRLLECCKEQGFQLDISSNKALAASLRRIEDVANPTVQMAVKAMATRAMSEAEYLSTGESTDTAGFSHYGLALEYYTHFTSPIRRYADVLVHRILMAALGVSCPLTSAETGSSPSPALSAARLSSSSTNIIMAHTALKEVTEHLNVCHRGSKRAQKECNELYLLYYLARNARAEEALVTGIHENGLSVFIPKYDLRGPAYLKDRKGFVILPLTGDEPRDESGSFLTDSFKSEPYLLRHEEHEVQIWDPVKEQVITSFHIMQSIWVELRADGSRAHAPTLRIRVLSDSHPAAKEAAEVQERARLVEYRKPKLSELDAQYGKAGGSRWKRGQREIGAAIRGKQPDAGMMEPREETGKETQKASEGEADTISTLGQVTEKSDNRNASVYDLVQSFRSFLITDTSIFSDYEKVVSIDSELRRPVARQTPDISSKVQQPPVSGSRQPQHSATETSTGRTQPKEFFQESEMMINADDDDDGDEDDDDDDSFPFSTQGDIAAIREESAQEKALRERFELLLALAARKKALRAKSVHDDWNTQRQIWYQQEMRARQRADVLHARILRQIQRDNKRGKQRTQIPFASASSESNAAIDLGL